MGFYVFADHSIVTDYRHNDPENRATGVAKGLVLVNNRHQYLEAPKLRHQFSVNHDKIQYIDYQIFINFLSGIC